MFVARNHKDFYYALEGIEGLISFAFAERQSVLKGKVMQPHFAHVPFRSSVAFIEIEAEHLNLKAELFR